MESGVDRKWWPQGCFKGERILTWRRDYYKWSVGPRSFRSFPLDLTNSPDIACLVMTVHWPNKFPTFSVTQMLLVVYFFSRS